jgi:hypothetical protein
LVAVALKVTTFPAHTGLEEEPISTLAVRIGFTVMVIPADVAGLPVAHVAFEVRRQVTTSVFDGIYV